MQIIIHTSPENQAEKAYVFQVLLGERLSLEYAVNWQPDEPDYIIKVYGGGTLRIKASDMYAAVPVEASFCDHPFLPQEDIVCIFGQPAFSLDNQNVVCGIDLFAASFFMLSRREEMAENAALDRHGRFPAQQSLAWRSGFLDRPVVNEYADLLAALLQRVGLQMPPQKGAYQLHLSCDVDHPRLWWSATERLKTVAGSLFARKTPAETAFWIKNHLFSAIDPYHTFDELMGLGERTGCAVHFNFLGKREPNSDCYYPLEHPVVTGLMRQIQARAHQIGFHPSYEAHCDPTLFAAELASLRRVSPLPVRTGRQHYLRFALPCTWQLWAEADMMWDSTLGYPEAEGFRCGICHDFPVFDLAQRKVLPLREKPLIAMDVTLAFYQKYAPERAFDVLCNLRRQVQKHAGEFVLLWHNSSLNTWAWRGWREVLHDFVGGK